ncbi:MAG: efflux RND transporter periplasmic adaptor subunit [Planctomycetota bacterium]|nr:efflux RND transporter periplasmic adaptor subunit [Planctomycetota bacterium]
MADSETAAPAGANALDALQLDRARLGPTRRRRLPGWLRFLLLVLVLVGGSVGYGSLTAKPRVVVATVLRTSPIAAREITTANGYVVARTRASLASKTQGRLDAVLVDEGDRVDEGQLLAVVEHDEQEAAVREAEAVLARARLAVPAAEASLAQVEAALKTAEAAIGEREAAVVEAGATAAERRSAYARAEELVQRQIQSPADLDRAREARDVAEARVVVARASLETARVDLGQSRAAVEVQKSQVELFRQDVAAAEAVLTRTVASRENAFIRAPFAGMVLRREAEPGEVVSPANTGASGSKTAVVTLADFATLEIEVDVYERDIARVAEGTPCRVVLDAYPDDRLAARVRLLRPTADRTRATVQVYVEFAAVPAHARPEMGARVTFYEEGTDPLTADELTLPESAIPPDGASGDLTVFVEEDGRVRAVSARFGPARDGRRAVLAGLSAGQRVCVAPPDDLGDGAEVDVADS